MAASVMLEPFHNTTNEGSTDCIAAQCHQEIWRRPRWIIFRLSFAREKWWLCWGRMAPARPPRCACCWD